MSDQPIYPEQQPNAAQPIPDGPAPAPPRPSQGASRPGPQYPPPMGPPPARSKSGRVWGCLIPLFVLLLMGGGFVGMVVLLVGAAAGTASPGEVYERQVKPYDRAGGDKVVILQIEGVIYGDSDGFIKKQVDAVLEDDSVKAVVLRVNSPGGTVSGSDYYLHHLKEMKQERDVPVIVSMGPMATSGGYYVSMCGDRIFAERTTITGSIGVIYMMYNGHELGEKIGLTDVSYTSHELKEMGSFFDPPAEEGSEEYKIWQAMVDDAFAIFTEVVREGRPQFQEAPEALDKLATGQVYTATQALENGLVDEIGFIEDAIEYAIDEADLERSNVQVVKYKREPTLSEALFGAKAQASVVQEPVKVINELATPQAYYMPPRALPLRTEE